MDKSTVLSTKTLPVALRERIVQNGFGYVEYNAIHIEPITFQMPEPSGYVIFTSQNATKTVLENEHTLQQSKVLCVGKKSEKLLSENNIKPIKTTQNIAELIVFIEKLDQNASFLHFCGNRRMPLLSAKMKQWERNFSEIVVYQTQLNNTALDFTPDVVLFFSPSGVESHEKMNKLMDSVCFCIGTTTANAITQKPRELFVSKESNAAALVAKAVLYLKSKQHA